MPIAEEKALEILAELIKKPESKVEDIPRIWSEIMEAYNKQFNPPVEPAPKRRRRRSTNPNIGWPAGVGRSEYTAWRTAQMAKGINENLNPQEYKRQRDAGLIEAGRPAAAAKPTAAAKPGATARAAAPEKKATAAKAAEKKAPEAKRQATSEARKPAAPRRATSARK